LNLDNQAVAPGIGPGNRDHMDMFHAERHRYSDMSNVRIDTMINCFVIE
jgi:hypothetical protein